MFELQQLMDAINQAKMKYNFVFSNCIDVAKAFVGYARGLYTEMDVVIMIMPDSKGLQVLKGAGAMRLAQFGQEIGNLFIP
jgi:hypothetical protein